MARYGNILTVFAATGEQIENVRQILINRNTVFEGMDNNFFIETRSKNNTRDVMNDLSGLGIKFIFFHNHNPDGSMIRAGGLEQNFIDRVNHILFE